MQSNHPGAKAKTSSAALPAQRPDNSDERFIDTMKFIEARAKEIHYFQEFNRKKHVGRKLVTQMLPKHMRRRAMSHSRIRIPSRIRKIAKDGFTKGVQKTKRFNLRKTARKYLFKSKTNLVELFAHNAANPAAQILETHQFHAKRMKMFLYGNFRVAKRAFAKQFRTAYKFSLIHGNVIDKSCYAVLRMRFGNRGQLELVEQFLARFQNYCYIVSRQNEELVVALDPFLAEDLSCFVAERKIEVSSQTDLSSHFNVLELIGPKSLKVLANCFKFYLKESQTEQYLQDKLQQFCSLFQDGGEPVQLPPDYQEMFYLSQNNRRILSEPFTPNNYLTPEQFANFKRAFYQLIISYRASNQDRTFLKELEPMFIKIGALLNDVKKVKDRHVSEPEKEPNNNLRALCKEMEQLTVTELFPDGNIPLLIRNVSNLETKETRALSKILVLAPATTGNFLLKNICKAGAKVLGLKEYNFLLQNHGFLVYPRDFVDMSASRRFHQTRAQKNIDKFLRYPDNKKFDFSSNSFPLPFQVDPAFFVATGPEEFVLYRFGLLSKGTIKENALVFECNREDYEGLVLNPSYSGIYALIMNYKEDAGLSREARKSNDREFTSLDDYCEYLRKETTTARLPIGQVTGGGFNYLQGKPAGACFVIGSRFDKSALTQQEFFNRKHKKPELQRYESKNRGLVLIRNPRSFDYHLAFLY